MRSKRQVSCMLVTLVLAGCASGPSPVASFDLPTATPAAGKTAALAAPLPDVRLIIDATSNEALRPRVEKLLSGSGLEATLLLDDDAARSVDFTVRLDFDYREVPLKDVENIWAVTDALLLTLYPATCNRYHFSLNATVEDAAGLPFRTYSLQDLDTAWVWLLVGPKCGSAEGISGTGVGDAAEQLLKELYRRMAQDRVFEPGQAAAFRARQGPLVYVAADRADDLIKDGFLLDDAPLRFTFDPAEAATADYQLRLNLSFSGRDYSAGRAWLAMMTVGLSGVCPTHTATLEGSIFDREGQLRGHYRTDAHWQPTMASDCALEGEGADPDRVRRLARELKAQVATNPPAARPPSLTHADAPLVWIRTNAAVPIVERVASERRPFQRVTLAESAQGVADYLLDLQFTSSGEGSRIDPAEPVAKQVAYGFMFGLTLGNMAFLCHPISYELAATLQDAAGTTIARYEVSRSETPKEPGCGAPGEPPTKVAETLMEQLYAQMTRDPRLPAALRRNNLPAAPPR